MLDWVDSLRSALPDIAAWQVAKRVFVESAFEEAWHYGLAALAVWLLLHFILRSLLEGRLITKWPKGSDVRREIAYSLSTVFIFGALDVLIFALVISKRVEIYSHPLAHGLLWLVVSLPILIVWQDFYFYWTHRLLHTRWLFRHIHVVHHRSRHPSPWAALASHPIESLNNSLGLLAALLVLPVNEVVLSIFVLHQLVRSTHGHAAVETMPAAFARNAFWGRFTTTTHHHLHHERLRGNYGLWFSWWDRLCGTEHPNYLERFDEVTAPRCERARASNEVKLTA